MRTYLVWRIWELSHLRVVVVDEINVFGGWCCCTHLFRVGANLLRTVVVDEINIIGGRSCRSHQYGVGTNLLHTYVPGMAYLRVVVPGSCCCCGCCCCFLHITKYLLRVLTDDDCNTDEGTPLPAHPAHGLTVK